MYIIPLELKYCEQVAELAKNSLPEHWSLKEIQDVLQYDHNRYFIAVRKGKEKVIGFAGVMLIADEAELLNIAVDFQYRKQGIGQLLLNRVLFEVRKSGGNRILLEVRKNNLKAISFYEKNHFEKIAQRKNYYDNPLEDAWVMDKKI